MHVGRDSAGRRRLNEIALLRRSDSGRVHAVQVWHADDGITGEADALRRLLRNRAAV